jgi:hypothetical protein
MDQEVRGLIITRGVGIFLFTVTFRFTGCGVLVNTLASYSNFDPLTDSLQ